MYNGILRRVLSLVMVLALFMTSCTVGYCEVSDPIVFDTPLTDAYSKILDEDKESLFDDSFKRAALTVFISIDLFVFSGLDEMSDVAWIDMLQEKSYVAKDGDNLLVYLHLLDEDIVIFYTQGFKGAYFCTMPVAEDDALEEALGILVGDEYYENNNAYINEVLYEAVRQAEEYNK